MKKLCVLLALLLCLGACGNALEVPETQVSAMAERTALAYEEPEISAPQFSQEFLPLAKIVYETFHCGAFSYASPTAFWVVRFGLSADAQLQVLEHSQDTWEFVVTDNSQTFHIISAPDDDRSMTIRKDGPEGEVVLRPYNDTPEVRQMENELFGIAWGDSSTQMGAARVAYRIGIDGVVDWLAENGKEPNWSFSTITDHSGRVWYVEAENDGGMLIRKGSSDGEIIYNSCFLY